jgi:hypothetical protein
LAFTAEGTLVVVIAKLLELVMVTMVLAEVPAWAALLAVTVIDFPPALTGALNKPVAEMLPAVADQVTAVLLVLLTVAVNCTFSPGVSEGSAGETCTETHFPQELTTATV